MGCCSGPGQGFLMTSSIMNFVFNCCGCAMLVSAIGTGIFVTLTATVLSKTAWDTAAAHQRVGGLVPDNVIRAQAHQVVSNWVSNSRDPIFALDFQRAHEGWEARDYNQVNSAYFWTRDAYFIFRSVLAKFHESWSMVGYVFAIVIPVLAAMVLADISGAMGLKLAKGKSFRKIKTDLFAPYIGVTIALVCILIWLLSVVVIGYAKGPETEGAAMWFWGAMALTIPSGLFFTNPIIAYIILGGLILFNVTGVVCACFGMCSSKKHYVAPAPATTAYLATYTTPAPVNNMVPQQQPMAPQPQQPQQYVDPQQPVNMAPQQNVAPQQPVNMAPQQPVNMAPMPQQHTTTVISAPANGYSIN